MLTVDTGPTTGERAARALPFLMREPVLHGIAVSVLHGGGAATLAIAERDGDPVAVGVCNDRKYLLSRSADVRAAAMLAEDAARRLGRLPGWMGPAPEVRDFTEAWVRTGGHSAALAMAMRIYVLDTVPPVPNVPGRLRPAVLADADLLAAWRGAFIGETGAGGTETTDNRAAVERHISGESLRVWEQDGRVVSVVHAGAGAPDSARIGLVYTPPDLRGRGYASACVAAFSAELLRGGRRYCYLYADLANPVSNGVYRRIGYRPVADVEDWRPEDG